jgi:hypothetical protein
MPLQNGRDAKGPYYRWGNHGKKYYYIAGNAKSRQIAKTKAMRQARAIEWRKHSAP